MLKNIHIRNYQSHRDTTLEFHKGTNIIVGPSDSGKSAILRALNWIINNKPAGDAFRSHWGGPTSASIKTSESSICRYRDKENSYEINGKVLKGFGQNVPEEISKAINIQETNTQRQMDSPYLLSETAGEIARQLNQIVDLEVIDTSVANVIKWSRQKLTEIQSQEELIQDLEDDLKKLPDLDSIEILVTSIEKLEEDLCSSSQQVSTIRSLQSSYEEMKEEAEEAAKIIKAQSIIKELFNLCKEKEETTTIKNRILQLKESWEMASHKFGKALTLKNALLNKLPKVCPTCGRPL